MIRSRIPLLLSMLFCVWPAAAQRREPEVYSPLGKVYFARADAGEVARADTDLIKDGERADLLLAAATARDHLLRFSESIPIYTRGMQAFPEDVRFPRFRGHRLISLRRFEAALADLKLAAGLAPTSFDVSYHLGLAYYFRGDFNHAAREYNRCLAMALKPSPESQRGLPSGWRSCYALDDDSRVALTDWAYRALRRAGKPAEASALLERINDSMVVKENSNYLKAIQVYKGEKTADEVLAGPLTGSAFTTIAYGLAVYQMLEGNNAKACALLDRVVSDENWSSFGLIGAETDLSRGACGPRSK